MPEAATYPCPKCNTPVPQTVKLCKACGTDLSVWQLVRSCLDKAEASLKAGRFSDARDEFQQALTLDAKSEPARQGVARAEEQMLNVRRQHLWKRALESETRKDFPGAEALYREIIALDPKDTKAAEALSFVAVKKCLELAETAFKAGKFSDARDGFQHALGLDPGGEQGRAGVAKAEEEIKSLKLRHLWTKVAEAEAHRDFRTAEDIYRDIAVLDPTNEKAKAATAALGLAAREELRTALEKAEAYAAAGKFSDARDEFEKALKVDAGCEQARRGIAKASEQMRLLRLNFMWNKAGEAETQQDYAAAAGFYREILTLDPADARAADALRHAIEELVRPRLERGEAVLRTKEFAAAREAFQQALAFDPACDHARKGIAKAEEGIRDLRLRHLRNVAWEAESHEDFPRAESLCREILALDPGDTKTQATVESFGILREITQSLRRGNYRGSLRQADYLVRKGPDDGKAIIKAKALRGLRMDYVRWMLIGIACAGLLAWQSKVQGWDAQLVADERLGMAVRIGGGVAVAIIVFLFGYIRAREERVTSLGLFKQFP